MKIARFSFVLLCGPHERKAERRAGDSNHRHAAGHKSEWRHFRRMGDVTNGLGQRDSSGEDSASARRHGGNGRNVVPAAGESGGHRQMLCARGENWADFDDHSRRGLGDPFHDGRRTSRHPWRVYTGRGGRVGETDSGKARKRLITITA
jgi:hypothetical protein